MIQGSVFVEDFWLAGAKPVILPSHSLFKRVKNTALSIRPPLLPLLVDKTLFDFTLPWGPTGSLRDRKGAIFSEILGGLLPEKPTQLYHQHKSNKLALSSNFNTKIGTISRYCHVMTKLAERELQMW
jgi:hypothetical protein